LPDGHDLGHAQRGASTVALQCYSSNYRDVAAKQKATQSLELRIIKRMTTQKLTRRKFMRLTLASTLMLGGNLAWGGFVEPHWLSLERVDVRLPRLPAAFDGLTIAQLSDFHYDIQFIGGSEVDEAVNLANGLGADLIVLTGDYISGHTSIPYAGPCLERLARLQAPLGVYAILGNHDHWSGAEAVAAAVRDHHIPLLRNAAVPLERDGARLWLAGVDDVWEKQCHLDRALQGVPRREATILLAHEPDFADEAARYPVDLQLSGHSHGGQVRLPFVGAPILPYLGRKYPDGLRYAGHLPVYTNRGLGMIYPTIRWNCPPEVTLFTLKVGA
jgi:predicted MPP superfamily phosphohydrolase